MRFFTDFMGFGFREIFQILREPWSKSEPGSRVPWKNKKEFILELLITLAVRLMVLLFAVAVVAGLVVGFIRE